MAFQFSICYVEFEPQHKFIEKCKWGASTILPEIEKAREVRAELAAEALNHVPGSTISGDAVWPKF